MSLIRFIGDMPLLVLRQRATFIHQIVRYVNTVNKVHIKNGGLFALIRV